MKVFYSNRLENLADMLRDALFFDGAHPFSKRRIVVPDAAVKNFLFLRWAKDPKLQIAGGVKIVTWASFLEEFLPSKLELSLRIENELGRIDDDGLRKYLSGGCVRRRASLADHLSDLFLHYHLYGHDKLKEGSWQKNLWQRVWKVGKEVSSPTALFHFSFLPKRYLEISPMLFCLSPSEMFWGDFCSPREQDYFPALKEYFQDQHPFLTTYGKMGREFFRNLDEAESEERYAAPKGKSILQTVQKEILNLSSEEKTGDSSIQIHAAPSKMREVEAVFELAFKLGGKALVYAPDINVYAPYIHMVFGGRSDYTIFDLELRQESLAAEGLELLFDIAKQNFSKLDILRLLSLPNFCEKFGFTKEESKLIENWRPWEGLIEKLVGTPLIDFDDAEMVGKWVGVIELLQSELKKLEEKKSVQEWMVYFQGLIEKFFHLHPEDEPLIRGLQMAAKLQTDPLEFDSVKRVLEMVLGQKSGAFQSSSLHGVKFASLGSALPADTIILMGMDESAFPRGEKKSSLDEVERDYDPTLMEKDRYLFLELFLSARKHFVATYCHLDEEDGKERGPSLVLEELRTYLPQIQIKMHNEKSFSKVNKRQPPQIIIERKPELIIDLRHLKKLARSPIEFFFERSCGIYFERKVPDDIDFVLSPWELSSLRKSSGGFDQTILPQGRFREVAIQRIEEERRNYRHALETLGVENVFSVEFKIGCDKAIEWRPREWIYPPLKIGRATFVGKLEDVSSKGILFHGEDKLDDSVKAWPLMLIAHLLPIEHNLLLTKEGEVKESVFLDPHEAFSRYITYYERSLETPSPLSPKAAKSILREGKIPDNEMFEWSNDWIPFLREVFHEAL